MKFIKGFYHKLQRELAKIWLNVNLQLIVIGVTGSYGKTNTVYTIARVLSEKYSVNKTDLNLDTIYNLPITILKTKIWNEILVLEYGIDHIGEMDLHLSLVKPKIGVLTGIAPVHIDKEHLGSLENLIFEKRKLIDSLPKDGWAVFNYDDQESRKIGSLFKGEKFFYGLNPNADIWAEKINITPKGTEFLLHYNETEQPIFTPLLGYPAVYSCLVGFLIGLKLNVPKEKIVKALSEIKPLSGRFNIEEGPFGTMIVNDMLRANLASTLAGLRSFSLFPGRKIAVIGEMGETGNLSEFVHREIGKELAKLKIDKIIGVGPLARFIIEEAENNNFSKDSLYWAEDVKKAAKILKKIIKKKDLIYLKASLLRHLERVILILEGKRVLCGKISCNRYQHCNSCPALTKSLK